MQQTKSVLDARNIKTDETQFEETCKSVTKRIFDGRKQIELSDIQNLRTRMKNDLLHLEFMFYVDDLFEQEEGKET